MKASILYYSQTGNTKQAAEMIAEGMSAIDGVEAKTFSIDSVDEAFVKESGCVVLGTPVVLASMAAPVKAWLDGQGMTLGLGGKLGGAFATANYVQGGADIAIQSIEGHLMVYGMLVYSGGAALGAPVIHLGPVGIGGELEKTQENFVVYGQRMASKAKELFSMSSSK